MDAIEILNHLAVGDQVVSNIMPSEEWMTGDRGIAMDRYKGGVSTSQRRHKPTYIILVHENYISVALQALCALCTYYGDNILISSNILTLPTSRHGLVNRMVVCLPQVL